MVAAGTLFVGLIAYQPLLGTHTASNVHSYGRQRNVVVAREGDGHRLDQFIQGRWESLIGKDATERIAQVAGAEEMKAKAVVARDAKLAERDTRQWCLDRCLATGHCDAVEDLLEMTTLQVKKFCQECASLDECELTEESAGVYIEQCAPAIRILTAPSVLLAERYVSITRF